MSTLPARVTPSAYEVQKAHYRRFLKSDTSRSGKQEEIRTAPLFSLKVKYHVDRNDDESSSDAVSKRSPSASNKPVDDENLSEPDSGEGHDENGSNQQEDSANTSSIILPQYALLGHHVGNLEGVGKEEPILLNVNAPNSTFICGSQGSGKSYTLSCMLENCLLPDRNIGSVQKPVAGVVFHYDIDSTSSVAEAAHLCSQGIKVKVLVSRSSRKKLQEAYEAIDQHGNLSVEPLLLRSSDLNIERMYKLMALADKEGSFPLYMEVIQRILREMAVAGTFSYAAFRDQLDREMLTKDQTGPLRLRLGLLESFLEASDVPGFFGKQKKAQDKKLFDLESGTLTVVDLSDPSVDASTVCLLFDICLGLIKEQRPTSGLVVAFDEAHRYLLKTSPAAGSLTDRLLTLIREQRHNATRVIVATQEPSVSEKLLDLCSMSIVHRFSSPAWFISIKGHLGGASQMVHPDDENEKLFERIVNLNVGESLVFAPAACVAMASDGPKKLGAVAMKMQTRSRQGVDGGSSILAS